MPGSGRTGMRIALMGTRGVPARYGGFETCVEEVGQRLAARGHEIVVYCRTAPGQPEPADHYLGMKLVHLPAVRRKVAETLSHTAASMAHIVTHPVDAAFVFNAANAPLLPVLRARGIPVATHVDGLEWRRTKWSRQGQRYYRAVESLAVRWSDALIADAQGIADYYRAEFAATTDLIAYGAPILAGAGHDLLADAGLRPGKYHLVVARFEPENHVDMIVEGYRRSDARLPLVVVGAAPYADAYTARVHALADQRVIFLGSVWDQRLLDQLYANALTYLHGHSVGGTNPSLLRAMGAGAAAVAFNVAFNSEVLGRAGRYFTTADHITSLIQAAEAEPELTRRRGASGTLRARNYSWDDVADRYERLALELPARRQARTHPDRRTADLPTGRRLTRGAARAEAARIAATAAPDSPVTGLLCGDFDVFHVGDLAALQQARASCDQLVVAILADDVVESLTGSPPIVPEVDRLQIVRHVRWVDQAVLVHEVDVASWERELGIDVLFTVPGVLAAALGRQPGSARRVQLPARRMTESTTLRPVLERQEALVAVEERSPSS